MVYLISGTGQGAGKTTLANRLVTPFYVVSLANKMREHLQNLHPQYDWFNKSQDYKDNTIVDGTGKSIRQNLVDAAESAREKDPDVWVRLAADEIDLRLHSDAMLENFAIDDIRRTHEVYHIRGRFPNEPILHFHIDYQSAILEPLYENDRLRQIADYVITRR